MKFFQLENLEMKKISEIKNSNKFNLQNFSLKFCLLQDIFFQHQSFDQQFSKLKLVLRIDSKFSIIYIL